jgi:hypothetical protein
MKMLEDFLSAYKERISAIGHLPQLLVAYRSGAYFLR